MTLAATEEEKKKEEAEGSSGFRPSNKNESVRRAWPRPSVHGLRAWNSCRNAWGPWAGRRTVSTRPSLAAQTAVGPVT